MTVTYAGPKGKGEVTCAIGLLKAASFLLVVRASPLFLSRLSQCRKHLGEWPASPEVVFEKRAFLYGAQEELAALKAAEAKGLEEKLHLAGLFSAGGAGNAAPPDLASILDSGKVARADDAAGELLVRLALAREVLDACRRIGVGWPVSRRDRGSRRRGGRRLAEGAGRRASERSPPSEGVPWRYCFCFSAGSAWLAHVHDGP